VKALAGCNLTYHLQFILPELLLFRFVKEGELSNMVYENVSEDGKLGIKRRHLSIFGLEGSAEPA